MRFPLHGAWASPDTALRHAVYADPGFEEKRLASQVEILLGDKLGSRTLERLDLEPEHVG